MQDARLLAETARRLRSLPSLAAAPVRAIRKDLSRALKAWPAREVVDLADRLLDKGGPAGRFVAYEAILFHRPALASLREKDLLRLGRGMCDWTHTDGFGIYLAGPAWRERQVADRVIRGWARSKDRWWRRAALVATVPLNMKSRGGQGDAPRTLDICSRLVDDRDDMVVKALSWALRELAEREPGEVVRFLAQHEGDLASRVLREVRNKLRTGLKNPRK